MSRDRRWTASHRRCKPTRPAPPPATRGVPALSRPLSRHPRCSLSSPLHVRPAPVPAGNEVNNKSTATSATIYVTFGRKTFGRVAYNIVIDSVWPTRFPGEPKNAVLFAKHRLTARRARNDRSSPSFGVVTEQTTPRGTVPRFSSSSFVARRQWPAAFVASASRLRPGRESRQAMRLRGARLFRVGQGHRPRRHRAGLPCRKRVSSEHGAGLPLPGVRRWTTGLRRRTS